MFITFYVQVLYIIIASSETSNKSSYSASDKAPTILPTTGTFSKVSKLVGRVA